MILKRDGPLAMSGVYGSTLRWRVGPQNAVALMHNDAVVQNGDDGRLVERAIARRNAAR